MKSLRDDHATGRLRAALSRHRLALGLLLGALMAGCSSSGTTPASQALQVLLPDREDHAASAAAIDHASLIIDTGDRRGMVVLGAMTGNLTYWPTGQGGLISLEAEALSATAGLREDLLASHYQVSGADDPALPPWRYATPPPFTLERTWRDADGQTQHQRARGKLRCDMAEAVELPLETRPLQSCQMELAWDGGAETRGVMWRDPTTLRLWAVETTPWPGALRMRWEIARRWWN